MDSKFADIAHLPGVSDLPIQVKRHFIRAFAAEMEGKAALAASELELAVKVEDAFAKRVIDVSLVGEEGY